MHRITGIEGAVVSDHRNFVDGERFPGHVDRGGLPDERFARFVGAPHSFESVFFPYLGRLAANFYVVLQRRWLFGGVLVDDVHPLPLEAGFIKKIEDLVR